MNPELRYFVAYERAQEGVADGLDIRDSVKSAAHSMAVDVGEVAQLVLEKLVACTRARESLRESSADATRCPACSCPSEVKDTGSGVRRRACISCGVRWCTAEVLTERTVRR